jgi:hypothetical protein
MFKEEESDDGEGEGVNGRNGVVTWSRTIF